MQLTKPIAMIHVNHQDKTGDFTPFLLSMSFTDHMEGEADGLEITLEDTDGRWHGDWFPVKGSTVEAWVGFEGQPLLSCGMFQVDDVEISGPPDIVSIRAVGSGNRTALRTQRSKGYRGKTLRDIAQSVASRHGLTLTGQVPEVVWQRVSQFQETDLAFLKRLAQQHGLLFTIKGRQLVFHDTATLENQKPILRLTRHDLTTYRFRDRILEGGAKAAYFKGDAKALDVVEMESEEIDTQVISHRTETKAHGKRLTRAAFSRAKCQEREASLTLPGNPRLVAGCNVEMAGFGVMDGLWTIKNAVHRLDQGGYTTELELRVHGVPKKEGA